MIRTPIVSLSCVGWLGLIAACSGEVAVDTDVVAPDTDVDVDTDTDLPPPIIIDPADTDPREAPPVPDSCPEPTSICTRAGCRWDVDRPADATGSGLFLVEAPGGPRYGYRVASPTSGFGVAGRATAGMLVSVMGAPAAMADATGEILGVRLLGEGPNVVLPAQVNLVIQGSAVRWAALAPPFLILLGVVRAELDGAPVARDTELRLCRDGAQTCGEVKADDDGAVTGVMLPGSVDVYVRVDEGPGPGTFAGGWMFLGRVDNRGGVAAASRVRVSGHLDANMGLRDSATGAALLTFVDRRHGQPRSVGVAADGTFELDLTPNTYDVQLELGHRHVPLAAGVVVGAVAPAPLELVAPAVAPLSLGVRFGTTVVRDPIEGVLIADDGTRFSVQTNPFPVHWLPPGHYRAVLTTDVAPFGVIGELDLDEVGGDVVLDALPSASIELDYAYGTWVLADLAGTVMVDATEVTSGVVWSGPSPLGVPPGRYDIDLRFAFESDRPSGLAPFLAPTRVASGVDVAGAMVWSGAVPIQTIDGLYTIDGEASAITRLRFIGLDSPVDTQFLLRRGAMAVQVPSGHYRVEEVAPTWDDLPLVESVAFTTGVVEPCLQIAY